MLYIRMISHHGCETLNVTLRVNRCQLATTEVVDVRLTDKLVVMDSAIDELLAHKAEIF